MPRISLLIAAALLLMACSLTSVVAPTAPTSQLVPAPSGIVSPSSTAAPAPTEASAPPTSTAAPSGTSVSYGNLSLVIPNGLSSGTTNTTGVDVEFPYINPSNGDMPQHIKVALNGYPVQGTLLQPQVMVFPAAQYAQYSGSTQELINALQSGPNGQPFPVGPFMSQFGKLDFSSGHGYRYLTQMDQAPLPVNNQELIYYFHGLTADGASYVEVILPITASFLAPDGNPNSALPSGGISFNMDQFGPYFQQVADKLNATAPDGFAPSLSMLDALVQSITIAP